MATARKPIAQPRTARFKVKDLRLHHEANREQRPTRVRELVRDMNLRGLGVFAVWRSGRDFFIIDGQHRKLALEELGLGDYQVNCVIFDDLTFAEACETFLIWNSSLSVRPYDKWDKGWKAGLADCVGLKEIVEEVGLRMSQGTKDGGFSAVDAGRSVWKKDEGESLRRSLTWATEAWGHNASAVEGALIRGFGEFASRFNGEVEDAAFITKLSKYRGGPSSLLGAARGQADIKGGSVAKNIASILVDVYNKGRRGNKLPPL